MSVVLETSIGDITLDLYTSERPRCCLNFLKLCKIKYYNFNLFHSVQRNLVAQTGDPLGTGRGGESVFRLLYGEQAAYFEMEVKPRIKHKKLGTLSMVNNGNNLHGSQFFVTLAENIDYLDGTHTVFGEVAEGFEVLQKLNEAFVDKENRPYQDIRIFHTVILDDPFDDPPGLAVHIPDRSPQLSKEQLDSVRIGVDEDIDDTKGLKLEEIDERIKEKEAKANAQILEMIGDLPEADVKPPDNVLFVCKLNPVTSDEDLEVIFSRFGTITSCEVIKDQKTKESLQYAFIEFEKPEDCEKAYFKMDNVLIDDRRIHVDFSQSVSKFRWKGKGKGVEQGKVDRDDDRPRFRIKDPDLRTDDRYDLVFDDGAAAASGRNGEQNQKKKKLKKHHKHRSQSDDSRHSVDNPRQQTRSSSRSPVHRTRPVDNLRKHHKNKHQSSENPIRDKESARKDSDERKRSKEDNRERHRSHDKSTNKKRSRDDSREKKRSREDSSERHRHDKMKHKHAR